MNNTTPSDNADKPARPITADLYVGKYFHSTPGHDLSYRGQITAKLAKDVYNVEIYFWKDTHMPHFRTFDASEMKDWVLFDSQDAMLLHYDPDLIKKAMLLIPGLRRVA
jgi:hypothetical protein